MDEIILKLEKDLDKSLELSTNLPSYRNAYVEDDKKNVIGLSLYNVQLGSLDQLLTLSLTLKELLLINCNIVDLSSIKSFQNLKKLELRENLIPHKELKHLLGLNNLTHLELSGTAITDASILAELSKLEYLNISSSSSLTKVAGLAKLSKLKYLDCSGSEYLNLEPIAGHDGISHLIANCSNFESMSGIERFPNLTHLDLSSTLITEIIGLENLRNLRHLNISSSSLDKISGLETLEKLESLDLGSSDLHKIEGLDALVNLKVLELGDCQITKIEGLEALTKLKRLQLRENEISKVENLENLVELEYLNVEMNKVCEIDTAFLLKLSKPCKIYLGSPTLKEKGLDVISPKQVEVFF